MTEELKVIITAEVDKLKQEMKKGKDEVEDFGKKGKASFSDFNDAVQSVGDISKKALAVTAGAIAGAATALLALGASTEEYRVAQAKLTTAFETAGASADTAKQTYNDLYRVLGDNDKSVEAANHLAKLTTNQKDLQQWTKICQGVYATFGDSLPIEGLTEAANETAKVGAVTGPLADALNWAGVSEDAFNEKLAKCVSTQEREALIRETLSGLYDEAATGYEENAKEIIAQNEAQARLNETTAELGEAMAPINTMLNEFATEVLAEITPTIKELAEEHGPTIKKVLGDIAKAIGDVLTWVIDNWELVSTIGTVVLVIAAALSVFSTVMGIVNAVMAASPVTWIVLAIVAALAALIAIIVLVVKHWDEIKAKTIEVFNKIKEVVQNAIDTVIGIFEGIINFVKENWQGLLLLIVNPFAGAFKLLYDNCEGFRETIDNLVEKVKGFFTGLWDNLKNGAKDAWNGVTSVFSKVTTWFKDKFSAAWNAVKNVFSTGGKIFDGIKDGITSAFKTIVNAIIGGINKVIAVPFKAINKTLSTLKGVDILGVKPFGWVKTFSIPEIPKLAKGGVVDSATLAMIGENGREAVLPLENNLEYLDKLASLITERMGGGNKPIVLTVDGKVFAQTSINTINDLTRQTGSLKLNIV